MGIVRPISESLTAKTEEIGALLKSLAPGMIRAAHALMGAHHPDVDDVVQQALIGLVQALPTFRGECSHAHFASRIVARTVVTARHRARVRADRRDDEIDVDAMESRGDSQSEMVLAARPRKGVRELLDE